ncbi:hypothetical protein ACJX0J_020104, partial [Zea mays]
MYLISSFVHARPYLITEDEPWASYNYMKNVFGSFTCCFDGIKIHMILCSIEQLQTW